MKSRFEDLMRTTVITTLWKDRKGARVPVAPFLPPSPQGLQLSPLRDRVSAPVASPSSPFG